MGGRRYNRFLHEINTWVFDKRHSEEVESMPNIKSAKKRVLLSREANVKNKMAKSALKTTLKKFDSAVVAGNREEATAATRPPSSPLTRCREGDPAQEQRRAQEEQHDAEAQRHGVSKFGSFRLMEYLHQAFAFSRGMQGARFVIAKRLRPWQSRAGTATRTGCR